MSVEPITSLQIHKRNSRIISGTRTPNLPKIPNLRHELLLTKNPKNRRAQGIFGRESADAKNSVEELDIHAAANGQMRNSRRRLQTMNKSIFRIQRAHEQKPGRKPTPIFDRRNQPKHIAGEQELEGSGNHQEIKISRISK